LHRNYNLALLDRARSQLAVVNWVRLASMQQQSPRVWIRLSVHTKIDRMLANTRSALETAKHRQLSNIPESIMHMDQIKTDKSKWLDITLVCYASELSITPWLDGWEFPCTHNWTEISWLINGNRVRKTDKTAELH
jgi:hypothetical protein